jgi:spore coat polysaccharide biosynthesis predicted glycosyltransferase SpsG
MRVGVTAKENRSHAICFVTDGGLQLGMGHVQQSTTFAKLLRDKAAIVFLTKSDDTIAAIIRESGFEVNQLRDDSAILQALQSLGPDIVIFDKLDVDPRLARDVRETLDAGLVIFTNLTDANRYADVAVTADIGSRFENISYRDPQTNTVYYYGPKFWVLRPEFYEYHRKRKTPAEQIASVLLIFGGSDPLNLTSAALAELLAHLRRLRIDVILGAQFQREAEVRSLLERHRGTDVTVHRNVKNVAELMYNADLVIGSPGLSVFEALCVGTPVIVMPQDALQRDTYAGFMRMIEKHEVAKLPGMIERREFTFSDEPHIARMEIGQGAEELVNVILETAKSYR